MNYSFQHGDATVFDAEKRTLLCHCVNNKGGWGKGFVLALNKVAPKIEFAYREWARSRQSFNLGCVLPVTINDRLTVANLLAQDGYLTEDNPHPLNLRSLELCLSKVAAVLSPRFDIIQMPPIGSGCGGSDWADVEIIVKRAFRNFQGDVRVLSMED